MIVVSRAWERYFSLRFLIRETTHNNQVGFDFGNRLIPDSYPYINHTFHSPGTFTSFPVQTIQENSLNVERERVFEVDQGKNERIIGEVEREGEERWKVLNRSWRTGRKRERCRKYQKPLLPRTRIPPKPKSPAGRSRILRSGINIACSSPINVDVDTDLPDHAQAVSHGLPPPTYLLSSSSTLSPQPQLPTPLSYPSPSDVGIRCLVSGLRHGTGGGLTCDMGPKGKYVELEVAGGEFDLASLIMATAQVRNETLLPLHALCHETPKTK
ncbi:hypothetical protein BDP27DRAFT_1372285 [Rhodocollybia butyracea]|uniref:Uncharacterized protein n=1 Tax=Rhodocollybia butyracea TaxID=206335 RepID=A0A9P5TWS6_9AGAR|nr:hypothetical protein BDP27DRAFT_1372285 [Rhodocollybia butyracea]